MKCELCHKADAETAVRKRVDGEDQELYVCRACAREASRAAAPASGRQAPGAAPADGEAAMPLMSMILDAAFEIVGRAMNVTEPTCPVCGITRAEYRKVSRLGCPACYEAFAKELESAILELHRSLQHAGKAPERGKVARQLQQLEAELAAAVTGQRYEEAIALRDRIKRLSGAASGPEGTAAC
jgi:protein arginine kinase activator